MLTCVYLCKCKSHHDTEYYHHFRKFLHAPSNKSLPLPLRGNHCSDFFHCRYFLACCRTSYKWNHIVRTLASLFAITFFFFFFLRSICLLLVSIDCWIVFHWVSILQFIHSPVDRHTGYFWFLAIINIVVLWACFPCFCGKKKKQNCWVIG